MQEWTGDAAYPLMELFVIGPTFLNSETYFKRFPVEAASKPLRLSRREGSDSWVARSRARCDFLEIENCKNLKNHVCEI